MKKKWKINHKMVFKFKYQKSFYINNEKLQLMEKIIINLHLLVEYIFYIIVLKNLNT